MRHRKRSDSVKEGILPCGQSGRCLNEKSGACNCERCGATQRRLLPLSDFFDVEAAPAAPHMTNARRKAGLTARPVQTSGIPSRTLAQAQGKPWWKDLVAAVPMGPPFPVPPSALAAATPHSTAGKKDKIVNPFGQNKDPFFGILGREDWTNPPRIPKDGRKQVTSMVDPYSLMVRFSVLDKNNKDVVIGTGALIGPRHILTAAHVVVDRHTGLFNLDFKMERWGSATAHTHENIYTRAEFHANAQNGKYKFPKMMYSGSSIVDFLAFDYALIIAKSDMIDPNSNFFQYNFSTTASWWGGRDLRTMGFPSNAGPQPCRATGGIGVEAVYQGSPFGFCDGRLLEESVTHPMYFEIGGTYVQLFVDLGRGQSGAPVFTESGNTRIIYAIASSRLGSGNYGHRLNEESVIANLDEWMADHPW